MRINSEVKHVEKLLSVNRSNRWKIKSHVKYYTWKLLHTLIYVPEGLSEKQFGGMSREKYGYMGGKGGSVR